MANGDVSKIAVLGRFRLPGCGTTTAGVQSQGKVLMWGELTCTAADAGINIAASGSFGAHATMTEALGLDSIDAIEFVLKSTDGEAVADDSLYLFAYSFDPSLAGLIHGLESVGISNAAPPTAGDALVLTFWAIGDTASQGLNT